MLLFKDHFHTDNFSYLNFCAESMVNTGNMDQRSFFFKLM